MLQLLVYTLQLVLTTVSCLNSLCGHINEPFEFGKVWLESVWHACVNIVQFFQCCCSIDPVPSLKQVDTYKKQLEKLKVRISINWQNKVILNGLFTWGYENIFVASFGQRSKLFRMSCPWMLCPWIILFLVRVKHGKQAKWKWVFHAMSKRGR